MTISLVLLVVMATLYACGVYLLLERSMTRVLLGFLLVGNATNLLIILMAGTPGVAPITGGPDAGRMTDPLPQALVLTAIVITFAVSAFLLALIHRSWRLAQRDELTDDDADIELRTTRREGSEFVEADAADVSEFDDELPELPTPPVGRGLSDAPEEARP